MGSGVFSSNFTSKRSLTKEVTAIMQLKSTKEKTPDPFSFRCRAGNSERMVAYNSWIKPQVTAYQDYYGGEGKSSFDPAELTDGVFNTGRQQGLQAHGCFIFEKRWGHIAENTPITKPKFNLQQLTNWAKRAQQGRYPISLNLEMYEDGSVSPESYELLKELKAVIRGK